MRRSQSAGLWVRVVPLAAVLAGCGAELRENREPPWDAHAWRERVRAHAEEMESLLPLLAEVRAANDPAPFRDTLRVVYHELRAAENSIPPVAAWEAELLDAEMASRYREAVRELRYGAEVMLDGLEHHNETRRGKAHRFLALGLEHFREARERMEPASREPQADTAAAVRPRSSLAPHTGPGQAWEHGQATPRADEPLTRGPGRSP
jgi:hypothetical protein